MAGKFFTFEGIDGCGKTTQIRNLETYLNDQNISVVRLREPGGTKLGEEIREILLRTKEMYESAAYKTKLYERTPESEMLLFLAARSQIVKEIIIPKLNEGTTVLLDRFRDSTRAYQGGGLYKSDPEKIKFINLLNDFVTCNIQPAKTFLFDIPYEVMFQRTGAKKDFIESREGDFFKRTLEEYRNIAKEEPERVVLIDGTKTIDAIFNEDVLPVVKNIYKLK